jgi:hypothetical protein
VFARTTVLFNSAGTTAKINFSTAPQVAIVALGEDLRALKPIFAFEGDSLTDVSAGTAFWPTQLAANFGFFNRGTSYNFALNGDTAANMVTEYASQAGAVSIQAGQEAYFLLWAGTNDVIGGATSAATVYGYLKSLWSSARTTGYKVVAFTLIPRGDASLALDKVRIDVNNLILSDATLYDYLVRPDAILTNTADTVNFTSGTVHLTATGNMLIAKAVAAAILGIPSVPASPIDTLALGGIQVNGAMDIDEVNNGAAITTDGYICDGYKISHTGTMAYSAQALVADAPPGLASSIKVSITTAEASLGASDFLFIEHPIEGYRSQKLGWGAASAQPISFGFWTKHHRTGAWGGTVHSATWGRSYPFTYTQNVADAWEYKTVTIIGDDDPADGWSTTAARGIVVVFAIASGTTFLGTANTWANSTLVGPTGMVNGVGATSDVFRIAGLAVVPGIYLPSAPQSPLILRPRDQELLLCQRYWWRWQGPAFTRLSVGYADTATSAQFALSVAAPMRVTAPTLAMTNMTVNGVAITAASLSSMRNNIASISATTSGATANTSVQIYAASGQTGVVSLDARL